MWGGVPDMLPLRLRNARLATSSQGGPCHSPPAQAAHCGDRGVRVSFSPRLVQ
jgi:hypothetical protein